MERIAIIGYGEAAGAFVDGGLDAIAAFDIDPAKRIGIACHKSSNDALEGATLALSLVTADQALAAARCARIASGALWCDMNSVAPDTKRAAARAIEAAGGRYLDVAIMAPVHPAGLDVPLLVSGTGAEEGAVRLNAAGFGDVRAVGEAVGRASSIKMIRSVMVKGIEALTAEMLLAADAAGVASEVLASLGEDWAARSDYHLERMATHGERRAIEMEEAVKTLTALGVDPVMTRGAVLRQRAVAAHRSLAA